MKLCFPIITGAGMESTIYGHFASAPWFLIVDTEIRQTYVLANCDEKNLYAGCNPFMALRDLNLDGIVVGGIGDDALRTMNMCGFRVYQAMSASVTGECRVCSSSRPSRSRAAEQPPGGELRGPGRRTNVRSLSRLVIAVCLVAG